MAPRSEYHLALASRSRRTTTLAPPFFPFHMNAGLLRRDLHEQRRHTSAEGRRIGPRGSRARTSPWQLASYPPFQAFAKLASANRQPGSRRVGLPAACNSHYVRQRGRSSIPAANRRESGYRLVVCNGPAFPGAVGTDCRAREESSSVSARPNPRLAGCRLHSPLLVTLLTTPRCVATRRSLSGASGTAWSGHWSPRA